MDARSPWWAIPLLSGLLALAGVVVGQVVAAWNERRRAKREDQQRWHQHRLELYFEYLEVVGQVRDKLWDFVNDEEGTLAIADISPVSRLERRIGLISTPVVRDAATELFIQLFASLLDIINTYKAWMEDQDVDSGTESSSSDQESGPEWDIEHRDDQVAKAFVDFMAAVRSELGVPIHETADESNSISRLRNWVAKTRSKRRQPSGTKHARKERRASSRGQLAQQRPNPARTKTANDE